MTDANGGEDTATVTINVTPSIEISADPQTIDSGEPATLTWTSQYADSVSIEPDIGEVSPEGATTVSPSANTTYTITATGPGGTATDSVTISIITPPSVTLEASHETIGIYQEITLTWTSSSAGSVSIEPDIGEVALNGSATVSPDTDTTYTATATGPGGTTTDSVTITVKPRVSLSITPEVINYGESTTLTWNAAPAQTAYFNQDIGEVASSGSMTLTPDYTTTYVLTAVNGTITTDHAISLKVLGSPPPESQPEGTFGEQYNDLITDDASLESYDSDRFIMLTGLVQDDNAAPLSGVTVSVLDHPEYGTVLTDANGRFSIPAEGGTLTKLVYEKEGYLTTHRKTDAPVKDVVTLDTVTLLSRDTAATEVTFDGNPDTVITHKSTDVTDEFGTRACTTIFTGDNTAYELDKYGNRVRELTTITARATEYTTPASMPAKLPPTSAYTYCAELEADGIDRIAFEKPVVSFVDNFLGFDVGTIVPVGYYDRDRAVWVPSENGVVVKFLDTDSDGFVDALDAKGDDLPDDLDEDGAVNDEIIGLEIAACQPGTTHWRFETKHFSPWDCNWPSAPPGDATAPNAQGTASADQQDGAQDTCNEDTGSHVEHRSRIMHQDIPIMGTNMTIHYASNRVDDYKTIINVPASGDTVPTSLKRIVVKCEIAGRTMETALAPAPDQKTQFVWDGLDYQGLKVTTPVPANIRIGFVYNNVYYAPSDNSQDAFAQPGAYSTNIQARSEVVRWEKDRLLISPPQAKTSGSIAAGWTISSHHVVELNNLSTLFKGNGLKLQNNITKIISTIAGNGSTGYNGDEILATEASIKPYSLAIDNKGNLFFSDKYNNRIRKIDTNGIITTVAGNGQSGHIGDGGPATEATLSYPRGIAIDRHNNIFFADTQNHCVRKIDTNGIITTVAGIALNYPTGFWHGGGYSGDNNLAVEAELSNPTDVALDQDGNLYIADAKNCCIRKVDTNGIITTLTSNLPDLPFGIEVDQQGNIYCTIGWVNTHVAKVSTDGSVCTIAGVGYRCFSGDGGLATDAELHAPWGIDIDRQGNIFFADSLNYRIRKIDTKGIITTVAGTTNNTPECGHSECYDIGFSGDGGPAVEATLQCPHGIIVNNDGELFIADRNNYRIRKMEHPDMLASLITEEESAFADTNGLAYIMDSTGKHKKTIDLETGNTLYTFTYETFGEQTCLTTITDQFNNQTTINRYSDGTPYAIVSPDGLTTLLSVDGDNLLTRITLPDNGAYDFTYTDGGLLTEKIEPESGHVYNYDYDDNGRVTDTYDNNGGHWQFDRFADNDGTIHSSVLTAENNLTTYEDFTDSTGKYTSTIIGPDGGETFYTRSADGLDVQKDTACGMDLDFTYDVDPEYKYRFVRQMTEATLSGRTRTTDRAVTYEDTDEDDVPDLITRTVSVNDSTTTLENDVLDASKTITSSEGRTLTRYYDPDTLATTETGIPGLSSTTYTYYTDGKPETVTTGTRQTSFTYDADGYLASVTDPRNRTTTFTNDKAGRVTQIDRPDNTSLGFVYDANGNMTVLTNPSGIDHAFGYNAVDKNTAYTTPLSGTYAYTYDKDRRLIQKAFPSGRTITWDYENPVDPDDKSRLWQIITPEYNIDYTYLCGSRVESITSDTASVTYGYDGKLVTAETLSGALSQSLDYTYNNDFNIDTFTYAGATEDYTYDNDGLLTGAGSFTISRYNDPGVNETGLPHTVTSENMVFSRTFNTYGETNSEDMDVNADDIFTWTITDRYPDGKIKTRTETINGTSTTYDYTYDEMGRLATVTKDGALVEEYAYDSLPYGTCTYQMNDLRGIAGRNLEYDDEDHLLSTGATDYQYDLDGFLESKTTGNETTYYDYASRGELLRVDLPDGTTIEYIHDPLGRRIAKKVNGTITEKYLWQGLTRLLAVYDGSDNLLMRFRYADSRMPVAVEKEGVLYYLAYNQVGSLRVVADSAGNIVKQIEYDAHGYILNDTNPGFDLPFGFAGGLHDRDTGLVRFGYRDYDPDTGRWTAKDPIGFAGGDSDLYGYVLNDPVNLVDPQGLMSSLPKWMLKKALKQIGKKIGKDGPSGGEIAYPEEQQQMDKDTDGDGINNYWDEDDDNDGKPDELDPMPETPTHPIPWDQKDNPCK